MIRKALVVTLALAAAPFLYVWTFERPANDRHWSSDQQILPRATVAGNLVTIRNVRNFEYRSEADYTPRYETRTYDLDKLDSVWFIVERFPGKPGVAHTLLSYGFGDEYVAISVEIRKEAGESYSPWKGLLRQYELMYVVADERDVVGLRTNHRHVNEISPRRVPFSFKVLLPAYSDRLAHDLGLIPDDLPFEVVQATHRIDGIAQRASVGADFSQVIRSRS